MDEKKIEDLVYNALTKFYQKVIAPQMMTKDDAKNLVTKDDAKNFATKEDINRLEIRLDNVEAEVSGLKKAVWNVSDHQGERLDEHEKRIVALEEA